MNGNAWSFRKKRATPPLSRLDLDEASRARYRRRFQFHHNGEFAVLTDLDLLHGWQILISLHE